MSASSSESNLPAGETRSDKAAGGGSTIETSLNRDLPDDQPARGEPERSTGAWNENCG